MDKNIKKTFSVEVEIDPKTNKVVEETWRNENGLLDRPGDLPASTSYDPDTSVATYESWRRDGQKHRDGDKPASLSRDGKTGAVIVESYSKSGLYHRDGGQPAIIIYDKQGRTQWKYHYVDGERIRDERVSVTDGRTLREIFWQNNEVVEERRYPRLPATQPGLEMK